jgi:hypothetical protein
LIAADVPDFRGGIQGVAALSRQPHALPSLADAFANTFWIAFGLIAVALVPALLLPGAQTEQQAEETRAPGRREQTRAA